MADTTPAMRSLLYQFESAKRAGDQDAMEGISDLMRMEQERIDAGIPEPDPAYRVDLYESSDSLYLVAPDQRLGLTYDVSALSDDERFEPVAVALLNGDLDTATLPSFPTPLIDLDALTRIASYDGALGEVLVERSADGVTPAAGHSGRRFIGYLEEA